MKTILSLSKKDFLGTLSYPGEHGPCFHRSHFNIKLPNTTVMQSSLMNLVSSLHCAKILYWVIWSDPGTNPERQVWSPPSSTEATVGSWIPWPPTGRAGLWAQEVTANSLVWSKPDWSFSSCLTVNKKNTSTWSPAVPTAPEARGRQPVSGNRDTATILPAPPPNSQKALPRATASPRH